ncbi:fibulin-2-like isoform X2 [Solea senegalensis]|uniref:Fibulin-2-like isoform X2 n=1 Tax=Solea senegalensis TaxID=28829 RepID=A0AAV6Q7Z3_SOLSE|nr:fibulin-2-like isoform X2 [Solea senegalensis]
MGLLAALVLLLCICAPGCSGLRHLENGRTFFRYGGLLVIFRCRPGYKLHGYRTNSCVSGHWARDPAVCVGSGCSDPGPLTHGTSSVNKDGSWSVFSCNSGFRLRGASMLYCKGQTWNSTKPVCKEFDMMHSLTGSGVTVHKADIPQNLPSAAALKTQQQSHYVTETNSASKKANLKLSLLSTSPERNQVANPKIQPTHLQFPGLGSRDEAQTSHRAQLQEASEAQGWETGTGREGADEKSNNVTSHQQQTTVSATRLLVSGPERPISSPPAPTLVSNTEEEKMPPSGTRFGQSVTVQEYTTLHAEPTQQVVTDFQASQPDTSAPSLYSFSTISSPTSSPAAPTRFTPSFTASTPSSPNSTTWSGVRTLPPNTSTTRRAKPHQAEHHALHMNTASTPSQMFFQRLGRRPVCPYPPVPTHGTFHFRNVVNPGPRAYRHFIQYACPPTQASEKPKNSHIRYNKLEPELTPCSVNNGGCSQLCSHSQHYDPSSNQTKTRTWCHCRPGFTLLDDGQTCRDVDECVEQRQHRCQHRCINTFGSFVCSCDGGYRPNHDHTSCTDIDECAVHQATGPCMDQCHNSPGSYRCSCTSGHVLAEDGHSCVPECPRGYRKQVTTPDNSTAQALQEQCEDINECLEERCEWQCVNLPGSFRCVCPRGHTRHGDGHQCKDINECTRKNGGCSHWCVNQKGGYRCACPSSHRLSPYSWKKCLPRTTAHTAG